MTYICLEWMTMLKAKSVTATREFPNKIFRVTSIVQKVLSFKLVISYHEYYK